MNPVKASRICMRRGRQGPTVRLYRPALRARPIGRSHRTVDQENADEHSSDVSMPILTETELVSAARRLKPDLPVVHMSASDHPDGSPVVIKPFRMQDLLDGIHRATACTL